MVGSVAISAIGTWLATLQCHSRRGWANVPHGIFVGLLLQTITPYMAVLLIEPREKGENKDRRRAEARGRSYKVCISRTILHRHDCHRRARHNSSMTRENVAAYAVPDGHHEAHSPSLAGKARRPGTQNRWKMNREHDFN